MGGGENMVKKKKVGRTYYHSDKGKKERKVPYNVNGRSVIRATLIFPGWRGNSA